MSEPRTFLDGRVVVHAGDCRAVLKTLADNSIDAVCTDPPYALVSIGKRFGKDGAAPATSNGAAGVYARASKGFMNCRWDHGATAFDPELWADVLRCMKPGAHGLAMGGTRTFHRLVCAIEDAGAEIRDCLFFCYGSGFPKSHDIALDYEKELCYQVIANGRTEWRYHSDGELLCRCEYRHPKAIELEGYGTALKPAVEPICLFRKPLSEASISANVLRWGTGAINVVACKVPGPINSGWSQSGSRASSGSSGFLAGQHDRDPKPDDPLGRWPANLLTDGSEEVLACFPETHNAGAARDEPGGGDYDGSERNCYGGSIGVGRKGFRVGDPSGSAARFFYTAKADADDRLGSKHPTVKPLDLIQYLARLITPRGGTCLDNFAGSGTTGEACFREGFRAILIEREAEYIADIERRMSLVMEGAATRAHASMKARGRPRDDGPLFGFEEKILPPANPTYGRTWNPAENKRPTDDPDDPHPNLVDLKIKLADIALAAGRDIEVRIAHPDDEAAE